MNKLKSIMWYFNKNIDLKILTCVDNLDARVISKFPLRPNKAGTKIKISETTLKTSQCCKNLLQKFLVQ